MKKYILALCSLSLLTGTISAQQKWTLEQCIDYAWNNNITIKSTALSAQSQQITFAKAKNQRLPNLNAWYSQPVSYGLAANSQGYNDVVREVTTSYSFGLSSSVTIFNGFQIKNNIAAQDYNVRASISDLNKARESMAVSIASDYLQVLYNKELYQVAKEQVNLSEKQVERSLTLASIGKIPEGQVYEIKAQLSKDKLTAAQSLSDLQLSILELAQLLDIKDWQNFDIVIPETDLNQLHLMIEPADEIYMMAVESKAAVKASEYRLKSSEKSLAVSKGAYYPSLSLSASYSNGYYPATKEYSLTDSAYHKVPLSKQLNGNYSMNVQLSLSIPLFNRFDTKNNVRLSKIDLENAKLNLESTKKELYKEIQQAWFNATTALVKINASKEAVSNSEEAFRFAEEKYNNGRATIYEYNEAKLNLASARSNELQAKYNYLFCVKILDFYKGEPLKL
jgi:outer membrane protein